MTNAGEPEEIQAVRASDEFLPTLRVEPLLGRRFTAADDTLGSPPTAMLSYAYWQRRFGGARDIVGRTLTLDGVALPLESGSRLAELLKSDLRLLLWSQT